MRKRKTRLCLTHDEWRYIVFALNKLRTKLIAENTYTDTIDDLLIKILN